eukprot:6853902-Prymnesium_polylepis.1
MLMRRSTPGCTPISVPCIPPSFATPRLHETHGISLGEKHRIQPLPVPRRAARHAKSAKTQ